MSIDRFLQNPHAGSPFDDSPAALQQVLKEISVPALLCSMVHMTGDPSWIRESSRPRTAGPTVLDGGMPDEEQADVRREALHVVLSWRDSGYPVHMPNRDLLREMMEFLAAGPIASEAFDLMEFDLQLDGVDRGAVTWGKAIDDAVKADSPVVVIGAGMAGIQAGIRLSQAGLPFTIIEKNSGAGGTWWENRYPGARVDVASHQYCYSFEPADHWTEYFCQHAELRSYFTHVLEKYELSSHCRFDTEVTGAKWDEEDAHWKVSVKTREGKTDAITARFVISAVGSLNIPHIPHIDGADEFAGPSFHSARWPEGFDYRGKSFALLGAGASGFQIAPTIAYDVKQLSIFQRTAQWVMPNPIYHKAVPDGESWAMRHLPFFGRWLRFIVTQAGVVAGTDSFRIDPKHNDPLHQSVNEINAMVRDYFLNFMQEQLEGRPDLIEKSMPNYPAMGKRILQDNGSWFQCLRKPNVDLIRAGIERIVPEGILTVDGKIHKVDVICYATGFRHNDFLAFDVVGRKGASLRDQWADEPTAYLGISVPNFPNFFMCYGPGTNLAHSAGLFFHAEFQTMHAMDAIQKVLAAEASTIEVSQTAHDKYVDELTDEISSLVWSHSSIRHSHYKNAQGKVYTLSPWSIPAYWRKARNVYINDYRID